MNRTIENAILALAAGVFYIALVSYSGHITVNDGLGPDGAPYAAMVTLHDVGAGTAGNRVWPAFPIAGVIAYAVTGNAVSSFTLVNGVALVLLVFAACLILDAPRASMPIKASAALSLSIAGIPAAISAFNPVQPYLLGVAMLTLAVAVCELTIWPLTAVAQVGAVLASPVGLAAPLYGITRSWRLNRRAAMDLLIFAPAFFLWVLIQTWARGGPAGLLDLLRLSRVYADAILWTESAFILFGAYFILTSI